MTQQENIQLPGKSLYLIALLGVLGFLVFLVFAPFLNILIISFIIVELFHPVYRAIRSDLGGHVITTVIFVLLFWLVLPVFFLWYVLYNLRALIEKFISRPAQRQHSTLSIDSGVIRFWDKAGNIIQSPAVASLISTLISFSVVAIPLVILLIITAGEALNFGLQAQKFIAEYNVSDLPNDVVARVNDVLISFNVPSDYHLKEINFAQLVNEVSGPIVAGLTTTVSSLLSGGLGLLFQLFLLIMSMIYLFQLRETLRERISKYSPLDDRLDKLFFDKFITTARAILAGTFFVAIAQASIMALVMRFMGFGSITVLWLIMVVLSVIPVGSGIVWVPASIVLMFTGHPAMGLFLLVFGAIVTNVIDSLIRPITMRGATNLHPLITLFSVLGGISLFGMIGILYGPLITVFFISIMHVYNNQNSQSDKNIKPAA